MSLELERTFTILLKDEEIDKMQNILMIAKEKLDKLEENTMPHKKHREELRELILKIESKI